MLNFAMQSKSLLPVVYLIANLILLCLFWSALSAVDQTAKMADGPDGSDFGDVLNFEKAALPILGLSLLLNIAYGIKALVDVFRREYLAIAACSFTFLMWVGIFVIHRMSG